MKIEIDSCGDQIQADFYADISELESKSSVRLARVEFRRKDGKKAIAFLTVREQSGKPVFQLTTKRAGYKETHKESTAAWLEFKK